MVFKILGILVILGSFIYLGMLSQLRFFGLNKIAGGDVGLYKNNQVVLTKSILYQNSSVKDGDVVLYEDPTHVSFDNIGEVVALPGEAMSVQGYDLSDTPFGSIPPGNCLVKINNANRGRVISITSIKYIVWGGL